MQIDTEIEIPFDDLARLGRDGAVALVLNRLRLKAYDEVSQVKGEIVSTILPEIVVKRTSSVLLGGDLMLVAARWTVDVPESFHPSGR
jgi:hypothetical protein